MAATIRFYRLNGPYGCFSNFSKHSVSLDMTWPTVEHYFQGRKFLHPELQMEIFAAPSPHEAARLGRRRDWPLRPDWEKVKDDVMRAGVRAKVMQHHAVRSVLLDTGDANLVEHTSNDSYWGDGGDGSGKNMLGQILMEIRSELTKDGPYDELASPMPPPWEKFPKYECCCLGWRMGEGEYFMINWWNFVGGLSPSGRMQYLESLSASGEWRNWLARVIDHFASKPSAD